MSFAAVIIVVACLLIGGCFALVVINVDAMVDELEQENELIAYVDDSYTETESRSLSSVINLIDNVASCTFVTKEEALQKFIASHEDPGLFAGTDASALRDRYHIVLEDITLMAETKAQLEATEGIAKVSAYIELAQGFATVRNVLRIVSYVIAGILLVISVFIISNTVKLATFNRREEIAIMKTVGATNSFIRWPFVIQGMILGFTSAFAAFFLQWAVYNFVQRAVMRTDYLGIISVIPFERCASFMIVVDLVVGFLVGVCGSSLAISKYLKK
jgi:cell division transport system permease protein